MWIITLLRRQFLLSVDKARESDTEARIHKSFRLIDMVELEEIGGYEVGTDEIFCN